MPQTNIAKKITALSPDAQNRAMENILYQFINSLNIDSTITDTQGTPERLREFWQLFTSGYNCNSEKILSPQTALSKHGEDMIVIEGIPIYTHYEKNLTPISGVAHVAYLPQKRVAETSNISQLVNMLCKRIQTQESLTNTIANEIQQTLSPKGVAVILQCQQVSETLASFSNITTKAFRGSFKADYKQKQEFLESLHSKKGY